MKNRKVRIEPCQAKLAKANFWLRPYTAAMVSDKVEKILKASMDLISSQWKFKLWVENLLEV